MEMNVEEIQKILPHRYPFLLVDRIVELDIEEQRVVGIKNVTVNEPFFQGHFPNHPVMPGVLQLEAMAQVSGVLMNKISGAEGKVAYFMAINNAKFRRMVVPGDQLRMEVQVTRMRAKMGSTHVKAYVGDDLACEADLMFGYGS